MKPFAIALLGLGLALNAQAQPVSNETIAQRIAAYKADLRGPYKEIRWYCPDGSILPPTQRCPEPGGVQRARHKDEVTLLGESNHVFLGQILATTPYPDFWDESGFNSRLKQYQLEKYLRSVDNGWVLRRAQYYRGAFQAEDEELWGVRFFHWLLSEPETLETQFFLIREAARDIPHQGDDNTKQTVRLLSREISDAYPPFLDIRVKIHGQPEASDIQKVKQFLEKQGTKFPRELNGKMDTLLREMAKQYKAFDITTIRPKLRALSGEPEIHGDLTGFLTGYGKAGSKSDKVSLLCSELHTLRAQALQATTGPARLALLDVSLVLEDLLFKELAGYRPGDLSGQIRLLASLGEAATGCGYLEFWEWDLLRKRLEIGEEEEISETALFQVFESARSISEWGSGMFMAVYEEVIGLYGGFEPLAGGFLDEKVRASLLLQIGTAVNALGETVALHLPVSNDMMDIAGSRSVRGLNPGIALGELVVVSGPAGEVEIDPEKIYVFDKPPSDLKPVAGIATASEGNPVSHIQLLARNLGIPNAVIPLPVLEELKKFEGQTVFYAVSPGGVVVMKPADRRNPDEKALFEVKARAETRIRIPVDRIDLGQDHVLPLTRVDARSSGKVCGPKAANLGQLKKMYPDHVVNGLVIPFGIFRDHLDQLMPGTELSYWGSLNQIFETADGMREEGREDAEIEAFMLQELKAFQAAIRQIPLSEDFVTELEQMFLQEFQTGMGALPVFLRSDTNMEDLKDFTGAGLNLTLFNVVSPEAILQGIRDVWASPYTERSYKWRQRYLLNPENVFPSILVIPSVNVDCSGVVVTKGVGQGTAEDVTVAFSRGAGGAVDGQAAESWLLQEGGENRLLFPAREPFYRTLPLSGGTAQQTARFDEGILKAGNLDDLRTLTTDIKDRMPGSPGVDSRGPFDIELGFLDDKLWLFQIRPFVENRNAATRLYLESLDTPLDDHKMIHLKNQ
ncbi:MAG: PEP/pyruvate-binding domain-containing protein [Bacteroidales bacterium]